MEGASWRPGLVQIDWGRGGMTEASPWRMLRLCLNKEEEGGYKIRKGCQSAEVYMCMHMDTQLLLRPEKTFSWPVH